MIWFEIWDDFYFDGKLFKILFGVIYYFRVFLEDWYYLFYNLKVFGFNIVEIYVVWNLYEFCEGEFYFEGVLDLEWFF